MTLVLLSLADTVLLLGDQGQIWPCGVLWYSTFVDDIELIVLRSNVLQERDIQLSTAENQPQFITVKSVIIVSPAFMLRGI